MENKIKEQINAATSMKEAEQIAEKLIYEISYEHKKAEWRTRYEYLRKEDFGKLGWKVFCVGSKQDSFKEWLIINGYKHHRKDNVYFNTEKRELFMVGEYTNGELVGIDDYWGMVTIITLDEYKNLLIWKLMELNEKRNDLQKFIEGMIQEHKDFLANEENELKKQKIINDAIEMAREKKLIL